MKPTKVIPISKERLKEMTLKDNTFVFLPERDGFEFIVQESGIIIPARYEQGRSLCMKGHVLNIGNRTFWPYDESECFWSYNPVNPEVKRGDRVFVSKKSVISLFKLGYERKAERVFEIQGIGLALLMNFWDLVCVIKTDNSLVPLNGWCIGKLLDRKQTSSIELPKHIAQSKSSHVVKIHYVNKNPVFNFRNDYPHDTEVKINEGDVVILVKTGSLPLDTDMESPFKDLRRLQRFNIAAKVYNFDPSNLIAGVKPFETEKYA